MSHTSIDLTAYEPDPSQDPEANDPRRRTGRGSTWRWFGQKLAGSAATLGFIIVLNFFLFRVINPHPERTLARGRATTPAQVQAVIEKYGLDQPLPQQFLTYLKNIVTLDFETYFARKYIQ